jgi:hypothetical protein
MVVVNDRSDLVRDRTTLLHRLQGTLDVAFPEQIGTSVSA